jgi:hypothetical protein
MLLLLDRLSSRPVNRYTVCESKNMTVNGKLEKSIEQKTLYFNCQIVNSKIK